MRFELSVIICTHNPRDDYFPRVVKALREQTLPADKWELLVIDNCSSQPVGSRFDLSWHPHARLVRENQLGLTPARLRGIREAQGDLFVFVDDDNVLASEYLTEAVRISREFSYLGAWSGQCLPEFEETPPEWTRRYWGNLCIRSLDRMVWSNLPRLGETMPAGAGMCVRRQVAARYLDIHDSGIRRYQLDRKGTSLLSGGDNDMAACACRLGLGVGLFPELKLLHLIPPQRLTKDYLMRLAEGIAFSSTLLDAAWGLPTPQRTLSGRLIDFLRTMREKSPDREIVRAFYKGRNDAARLIHDDAGSTRPREPRA